MNYSFRLLKLLISVVAIVLPSFSVMAASTPATTQQLPIIKPVMTCDQLAQQNFSAAIGNPVKITNNKILSSDKGQFCQISATIAPSVGVQIALPSEHWTQRFLQVGCGGMCGNININLSNASGCVPALNGEFTVAATDMGHHGDMMDATWARDPQQRIDFAYRANHVTAELTKAVIAAYYGQSPKFSYFMGCSDGGREALMEAQRYPKDFNGISAGAPAAFFQFQNSFYHGWNTVANMRKDGTAILLKDRLSVLHQAVLAHCPTGSGVNDGILADPYACHFNPDWVKVCKKNSKDKSDCMTPEEIQVAQKMYEGATDAAGHHFVLGGLPLGSELNWPVPETPTSPSMSETMVIPALQNLMLPTPQLQLKSLKSFPLNISNFRKVAELAPLYNATNTDLRPFMEQGGKLIMWHGLADDSVSPVFSLAYYHGVERVLGDEAIHRFMRLFLLPGVGHCGGGVGLDQVDLLTPLMTWVEADQAPQSLISGKLVHEEQRMGPPPAGLKHGRGPVGRPLPPPEMAMAKGGHPSDDKSAEQHFHGMMHESSPVAKPFGELKATRPVYPYPYIAQYIGHGDPLRAENYKPVKSDVMVQLTFGKPAIDYIGPDNQRDYAVDHGQLLVK